MRNSSVARKPIQQKRTPQTFEANVLGHLRAGGFAEVVAACKGQLTRDPDDAIALHYLATALAALDQPKHALTFHALAIKHLPTNAVFHYQLGQTFMQLRLWDGAAKSYQIAMKLAPAAAGDAPVPIFIVGMPRSGSTLCESILASHSQVTALGELGEIVSAVRRLETHGFASQSESLVHIQESYLAFASVSAAKTPFVVDKYLGNFFYIGHILHAFPNARVLHIHRDPRAVAWSI